MRSFCTLDGIYRCKYTIMLLVYLEPFQKVQLELLYSWTTAVHYWPRSYAHTWEYNAAIPTDWWMLFSNPAYADIWLIKYPDHTRVIKTLFDDNP